MNGRGKPKSIAAYADVSVRTIRTWLKQGLKHSRVKGGAIPIKYSDLDDFLKGFEVSENKAERIIEEVLRSCNQ